jgi:glutathione S-transferase
MRQLYHHPLDPHSRFIRLVLAEKYLEFEKVEERFWERREAFMKMSPDGSLPVLQEPTGVTLSSAAVIAEYIEETAATPPLLGTSPRIRAEVRHLMHWFLYKFHAEVSGPIMFERLWKRLQTHATPDAAILRAASFNSRYHLSYIKFLTERRVWLAGDALSLADLAAAAMLSSLDYLGSVPWEEAGEAKEWYAKIKCRPSFRSLLADHVAGLPPSAHYTNLDF